MAEINGKDPSPTEEQAQEEVSASRQNFRKELNEKLEALFEAIKFDDNHPSVDPTSGPNLKVFEVLKVDKQTFVDNGVNIDICGALFDDELRKPQGGSKPHGDFRIELGKFETGILLIIENLHRDEPEAIFLYDPEDNFLQLASTAEGNSLFIVAFPYQPYRGVLPNVPPYKPVNLDQERKDCFAVIETITVLARQTGFIKG